MSRTHSLLQGQRFIVNGNGSNRDGHAVCSIPPPLYSLCSDSANNKYTRAFIRPRCDFLRCRPYHAHPLHCITTVYRSLRTPTYLASDSPPAEPCKRRERPEANPAAPLGVDRGPPSGGSSAVLCRKEPGVDRVRSADVLEERG